MSAFSPAELAYLGEPRLGRLATIDADGVPHVVPLGWTYNPALETIDIGGRDFARTKKSVTSRPIQGCVGDRRRAAAVAAALRHGARHGRGFGPGDRRAR
jgi:hypothetical protein